MQGMLAAHGTVTTLPSTGRPPQRRRIPSILRAGLLGYRQVSQEVCPYIVKFAQELKEPAFAPRELLAGKDARTLARDLLTMTQEEFSVAFKGSPMKRATRRGLKRNAAVVLGNVRTASQMEKVEDVQVLARALDDPEPLVREHASRALRRAGLPLSG
jgi:epoxyqueuosine reductase